MKCHEWVWDEADQQWYPRVENTEPIETGEMPVPPGLDVHDFEEEDDRPLSVVGEFERLWSLKKQGLLDELA